MIVIYMVKNCVNGKVYIGSTGDVNHRFNKHEYDLNNSIHHNDHLQRAWNKYGSDSFEFKTLMVCPDNERNHCEQMFIDLYDSQNHEFGYNIRDADSHSIAEETKVKMSKARIGYKWSEESKKKLSESISGKNHWNYGNKHSDETKQKMSENHADFSGENHPQWKNYARVLKSNNKHYGVRYYIKFKGKQIKNSKYFNKLIDWFFENYPDEDLEISMEVLDNALFS